MIEAIVAVYPNWGIGCCGTQPVVIKKDRAHFREITGGSAVIVGRKTLADFPGGRPLKNRTNIVVTKQNIEIEGALVAHSVEDAVALAQEHDRVFVIGGESVYRQLMPETQRIYVTMVYAQPDCDAFFPDLDADPAWKVTEDSGELYEDGLKYRFRTYERI